MSVVIVIDSTGDVTSVLEVLPRWGSYFVNLCQNILRFLPFGWKGSQRILSPLYIFLDRINPKVLKLLVNVSFHLRNVSGSKSEPSSFDIFQIARFSKPTDESQSVLNE